MTDSGSRPPPMAAIGRKRSLALRVSKVHRGGLRWTDVSMVGEIQVRSGQIRSGQIRSDAEEGLGEEKRTSHNATPLLEGKGVAL